jgi:hypothetical protein
MSYLSPPPPHPRGWREKEGGGEEARLEHININILYGKRIAKNENRALLQPQEHRALLQPQKNRAPFHYQHCRGGLASPGRAGRHPLHGPPSRSSRAKACRVKNDKVEKRALLHQTFEQAPARRGSG